MQRALDSTNRSWGRLSRLPQAFQPDRPNFPSLGRCHDAAGAFASAGRLDEACRQSCPKVQFYRVDERDKPGQKPLMGRMVKIRVQRRFILELHDAAKRIAPSSRRDIWADVGLKKSRDYSLKSRNVFLGSLLLSFRCPGLPLEREHVKNSYGRILSLHYFRQFESEHAACDGGATKSQHDTAC
jgi:hypothetical protein